MSTLRVWSARASAVAVGMLLLPVAAGAQSAGAAGSSGQGPMTVERVKSGFLVAPGVKITDFDHHTSELIGAEAGWLAQQMFFVGGGGYWMVNGSQDQELAYGGLVLGLSTPVDRPFSFGVKGLLGGGHATVSRSITYFDNGGRGDVRIQGPGGRQNVVVPIVTNIRVHEDFLVAE